jgi:hypothetical protein
VGAEVEGAVDVGDFDGAPAGEGPIDVGDFVDEAGLDGVLGAEVLVVGVEEFEEDLVVFDGEDGEGFGVAAVFEGIEGGTGLAGGGFGATGAFARGGGAAGLIGHDGSVSKMRICTEEEGNECRFSASC